MENTILLQTAKILDEDSLFLASSVFLRANRTVRDIHLIVTALLRYALMGASITNSLMGSVVNTGDDWLLVDKSELVKK